MASWQSGAETGDEQTVTIPLYESIKSLVFFFFSNPVCNKLCLYTTKPQICFVENITVTKLNISF